MPGGGDRTHTILRSLDFKSLGASLTDCEADCNKIGQLKRWQLVSVPILECPASMLHGYGEQGWIAAARCGKHSFLTGSATHPWVAGGPAPEGGPFDINGIRKFWSKNSPGAADNVRQSHLSSRFVGVKRNYQLF